MKNDSKAILDDILARWHSYCRGFNPNPAWSAEPMFQDAASRGGWDSADDILDAAINSKIMQAVDFQVSEMQEPYKAAIYVTARNLHTGLAVWSSPRLPADPLARGVIVVEARAQLTKRLATAGVM